MSLDDERAKESDGREAFLGDLGNLQEVAVWLLQSLGGLAAAGVVGNAAYDTVKALRRRFGDRRLEELKQRLVEEIQKAERRTQHRPGREIRERVEQLFEEARR